VSKGARLAMCALSIPGADSFVAALPLRDALHSVVSFYKSVTVGRNRA